MNNNRNSFIEFNRSKSITLFLVLYISLISTLILLASILYYNNAKEILFSKYKNSLNRCLIFKIKRLDSLNNDNIKNSNFENLIYDLDKKKHLLETQNLFIEMNEDLNWYKNTIFNTIIILSIILFIILVLFGIFFINFFLKPMQNSISLLNNFIKDTTHELNTPISIILNNIEMINLNNLSKNSKKQIERIEIATKTLYDLYQDISYLALGKDIKLENKNINLKDIINDRIQYFALSIKNQNIKLKIFLEDYIINIDQIKITRVIDNFISNALKYNKKNGVILIILNQKYLIIMDKGIGIPANKIDSIFNRYSRFNESKIGFGIGLNIVKNILQEYNIKVKVTSKIDRWTKIKLYFNNKINNIN